ncbi:MAG: hypothetical protein AB7U52_01585 [Candidatus Izemoplasmatales bacterium]
MRIFGRFLYALLAVGLFLLVFTYTIDLTANRYYEEVFGTSLTDEDSTLPEFYYFYTSIPDFHKSEPIIIIDQDDYQIRGYEIARAEVNEENIVEVIESVYIVVYSKTQDLSLLDRIKLVNEDNSLSEELYLIRFKTLNILNAVNEQGYVYIPKELFLDNNFGKISIVDAGDNTIIESDFNLFESDFTIKQNLEEFFADHGKLPDEDDIGYLSSEFIGIKTIHVDGENALNGGTVLLGLGIYFIILIIATYLIFFRRRKYE